MRKEGEACLAPTHESVCRGWLDTRPYGSGRREGDACVALTCAARIAERRATHASPLRMRAFVGAGLKPAPTPLRIRTVFVGAGLKPAPKSTGGAASCAASGGVRRRREVLASPRREGANDEAVEAARKGCRIVR